MIDVRVRFWAGTNDEFVSTFMLNDNATVLDLKNTLVDPNLNTPFSNYQVTQFGIAAHPNGYPHALSDSYPLVDDADYDAVME